MNNARKNKADNAMARGQVYGLLAASFRAEPTGALLKEIKSPSFSGVFADIGASLGEEFYQKTEAEILEELAVEFTRLFLGPGSHISAHESVFSKTDGSGGGLWGTKTVEVRKFIETAGLDYKPDFTGLPDHISVELEFMQKLAETEAGLRAQGEAEKADWCLDVQKKFINEHLNKWVPDFCDEVIKKADMPFYGAMAALTRDFLEFDRENVDERLALVV